jgi:hypothetical protein
LPSRKVVEVDADVWESVPVPVVWLVVPVEELPVVVVWATTCPASNPSPRIDALSVMFVTLVPSIKR